MTGPAWTRTEVLGCFSPTSQPLLPIPRLVRTAYICFQGALHITGSSLPYAPAIPLQGLLLTGTLEVLHYLSLLPVSGVETLGALFSDGTLLSLTLSLTDNKGCITST